MLQTIDSERRWISLGCSAVSIGLDSFPANCALQRDCFCQLPPWPDTSCELRIAPTPRSCTRTTQTSTVLAANPHLPRSHRYSAYCCTDTQLVLPSALTGSSVLGLSCSFANTSLDSIASTKPPTCSLDGFFLESLQLRPSEP